MSQQLFAFMMILGVAWLGLRLSLAQQRRHRAAWASFADARGLAGPDPTSAYAPLRITGVHEGVPIHIHTVQRSSGKSSVTYTVCAATIGAPLPTGLVVTREALVNKIGQMLLGKDVQVGDPEVDPRLNIRATDARTTAGLLRDPRVKEHLLRVNEVWPGWILRDGVLTTEVRGVTTHASDLGAQLDATARAAAALRDAAT
ncbi:MAG TPA: hypothetical protein PKA64_06905, partial [Myxococcota bacterium]|nr:hypothetical protein [Myxococcota bacterium]